MEDAPTRWLLKNTDTFAGFAHAMNSYLAGVALAARHGLRLIHRPQQMAHGIQFAFVDFFDSDPRGIVPPVYAPTLSVGPNGSAMLILSLIHISEPTRHAQSRMPSSA